MLVARTIVLDSFPSAGMKISQVFRILTFQDFFSRLVTNKTFLFIFVSLRCSVHADISVDYVIQIQKLHVQLFQLI